MGIKNLSFLFFQQISKKCICIPVVLLFLVNRLEAKTYYISSASGSDSYSSTQAQSASTPWKSIAKLNSVFGSFSAGDSVLFKRGETFYGTLTPIVSGVIFSAYGTGAKPILSGLTAITSWTSLGANLWKSSAISSSKAPCVLTINGVAVPYGRFPNSGYNYFESHSGTTSITDNQLSGTPSFTGGELVLRVNGYELNRYPISGHSGSTITYTGNKETLKGDNYGYFIQNHIAALDVQNEWCYDISSKTIIIYSTSAPTNIKVSTLENVCNISGVNSLVFKNIAFEGGNSNTININNSANDIIDGCDISNSGVSAISGAKTSSAIFQNCTIYNSYDNGFDLDDANNSNIIIRSNRITKSGAVAGMGLSGSGSVMNGVGISGSGHTIEYNTIDSSGYSGIIFKRGSNNTIKNNVINTYCFVKHDGGGIYTWNNDITPVTYTNNKLIGNIILNGIGAPEGTSDLTNYDVDGIMMDDNAGNVTILDNTVSQVAGSGLYIHNNFNMNVQRNTLYNNGREQLNFTHNLAYINGTLSPYTTPLRNITFKNNILFSKTADQTVFDQYSIRNDLDSTGVTDSNYYARPIDENWIFKTSKNVGGVTIQDSYDLDSWKAAFKKDAASKKSPRTIPAYKINSLTGNNLVSYGQFLTSITGLKTYSSNLNNLVTLDLTSKLTGTGSLKVTFPLVVPDVYTLLYSSVGAVSNSKNYILRFSTLGTTDSGTLRVYLRQTASPYSRLTPVTIRTIGKTRKDFEFLFTAPVSSGDAIYAIELNQNSGTTYVDNIEFYEANVTMTNPDDLIRFEYNPTNTNKTVALDANYIGVDNTSYSGSLTLLPYTSKVLIRDTASVIKDTTKTTTGGGLSLAVNSAPISCYGGNTTISVSASGGKAPYTGTGSITASAGMGSLNISFPVASNTNTLLYSGIGPVSSSKNYIFRFTTLGTTENGALRTYIRQTSSPYGRLTPIQTSTFGTKLTSHEFLFTKPTTETLASFMIEISQNSGTTYISNIEFYEATSTGALIGSNLYSNGYFTKDISNLTSWSSNNNQVLSWDNSGKIPARYTFIVKDATGLSADTSVMVTQPSAPLVVSASAGTISFFGGTTTVNVTATGGTAPYKGTGIFTVTAGSHTYTVTDANGCYASAVVNITQPDATLTASAVVTSINCFGESATATVSAVGGTAPYTGTGTYLVAAGNGSLKLSFTSPISGNYTKLYSAVGPLGANKNYVLRFSTLGTGNGNLKAAIRLTNSPWTNITPYQTATFGTTRVDHQFLFTGLTAQTAASFLIEIDQASGTTYIDNVAFFEATSTGAFIGSNLYPAGQYLNDIAGVTAWSSNNNHTIAWDNTSKINDVYYYTVTDATGSTNTVTINTSQPASALQVSATAPAITVKGGTTTVTVSATGGTASYTGTGTFSGVKAGTYTYTVTDAKGCTASKTITITQPASRPASSAVAATDASTAVVNSELNISAYPNPSTTEFNLLVEGGTSERVNVLVSGIDGRMIYQTTGNTNQNFTLGSSFRPGIYIIQVLQGKTIKNLKIIKLR